MYVKVHVLISIIIPMKYIPVDWIDNKSTLDAVNGSVKSGSRLFTTSDDVD